MSKYFLKYFVHDYRTKGIFQFFPWKVCWSLFIFMAIINFDQSKVSKNDNRSECKQFFLILPVWSIMFQKNEKTTLLTHCIYGDHVFLKKIGVLFNRASMRLLYSVSHFGSGNLWWYSLNLINLSNRFQCPSVVLADSFSTETK